MLAHLKKKMARSNTCAASSSSYATSYRWCYVEQVDQAEPLANRSNGWRYMGPRGVTYRRQAVFGTGYRIRISFPSSAGPGHQWFNSHPLGGDPNLYNFQTWARTVLRRGMVHPRDAVLVVSAADETWRVILCWASAGREIEVNTQGIPISLVDLQVRSGVDSQSPLFRPLTIATFGHRVVRYAPITAFRKKWQEQLPGACLVVLVADAWRDSQVDLLTRERRRFGFRDVDPTGAFMISSGGGRPTNGAPVPNKNYFRNLYSILLERDIGEIEFDTWWLCMTKASVVVWSHRGTGADVLGPSDGKTSLRPSALHVGVREGHVYHLVLGGAWRDGFGSSLDVAVEHGVRTYRKFRRTSQMTEEEGETDTAGCGTKSFSCVADIVSDIMAISQTEGDRNRQPVQKRKHRGKTSEFKTWYAPPGTALDELMHQLHLAWVSCRGRLTNYSRWYSLSLPAHGIFIRTWCSSSMEGASESSYGREDWQCDINGAHTATLMSMETVPVFGHMDELDALDEPDVFLNADVTLVFGQSYKRYLDLIDTAACHRVTHFVRPSRTVGRCHIPKLVRDLCAHELGEPLLEDPDRARKFKKGIFVRASGMLQQRYADRIDEDMVTGCDQASAEGGKIVPVLESLGMEPLQTGDAYLCLDAERAWYRDGLWALGALILDETRIRVLEARNALECCGASDFSYQCDAVFFRGSSSVQKKKTLHFKHFVVKRSLDALPPAMRKIPYPRQPPLLVIPLWDGNGTSFSSMKDVRDAWHRLGKNTKRHLWPAICEAESPSKLEGLVLTPTNSLRTSYINLPSGWSIRTPKVDVFIIEEAASMPLRTLSMILAAASSSGTHVIGTYDTHQLQPICDSSGMAISMDNVERKMDDGLWYSLAAENDSLDAQARAIERFGSECLDDPSPSDFHLTYTIDYARFHAFRGLLGCSEAGDWDGLGCQTVVGAQYRDLGNPGKVHKNHMYNVIRSSADTVVVASVFDDGASLEETSLCRAETENLFDPPGACAVHAVQGRTVEGRLIIHQARHFNADVHRLYTALSRATGPSNVRVIDDVHRSENNMSDRERVSWVSRKVSSYIYADVTAGRLRADEGGRHRETLVQELHRSYGGRERQPTLDRLDCALPHTIENVDVKCPKCNRAREA
ncbi:unnamed protein product [Ectocarpus sp. CCAP 1310/34]|nr:unnamed protein product [Ectocarpus sp. CCAP 1310/34]